MLYAAERPELQRCLIDPKKWRLVRWHSFAVAGAILVFAPVIGLRSGLGLFLHPAEHLFEWFGVLVVLAHFVLLQQVIRYCPNSPVGFVKQLSYLHRLFKVNPRLLERPPRASSCSYLTRSVPPERSVNSTW